VLQAETITVVASALSSPGSVALLAVLHPGRVTTMIAAAATATRQLRPLGLAVAVDVAVSLTTRAMVPATAQRPGLLLLLLLLPLLVLVTDTVDMATTRLLVRALPVLTLVLLAMAPLLLPQALPQVLVPSSRPMVLLVAPRHLHHPRLALSLRLRLHQVMPRLLHRPAMCHPHPHLRLRHTARVVA